MPYDPNKPENTQGPKLSGAFYARHFAGLVPIQPNTKKKTWICLNPMLDSSGRPVPNILNGIVQPAEVEYFANRIGITESVSGWCRPSDRGPADAPFGYPLQNIYIQAKSRTKDGAKRRIEDQIVRLAVLEALRAGDNTESRKGPQGLARPRAFGLLQATIIQDNDTMLPEPVTDGVVLLSEAGLRSLCSHIINWAAQGIDVFAPNGPMIEISGDYAVTSEGVRAEFPHFTFALYQAPTSARGTWVPWESAIVRRTYDEQIVALCKAFGNDFVAEFFRDDVMRLIPNYGAVTYPPQQAYQPQQPAYQPQQQAYQPQQQAYQPQQPVYQPAAGQIPPQPTGGTAGSAVQARPAIPQSPVPPPAGAAVAQTYQARTPQQPQAPQQPQGYTQPQHPGAPAGQPQGYAQPQQPPAPLPGQAIGAPTPQQLAQHYETLLRNATPTSPEDDEPPF